MKKNILYFLILIFCFGVLPSSHSHGNNNSLEQRVYDLERQVDQIWQRLRGQGQQYYTCMLITSQLFTFSATGPSEEEARFATRSECERLLGDKNKYECQYIPPQCSLSDLYEKHVCVIKGPDSRYLSGEGRSRIEAEANARKSCQNAFRTNFCQLIECNKSNI